MYPNNGPPYNGPPMRNQCPPQGGGNGPNMGCPPQRQPGPPGQCGPPSTGPGPPGPGGGFNRPGPCGGPSGQFQGGQQQGGHFGGQQQGPYGGGPGGQCGPQQFGNPRQQGPSMGGQQQFGGQQQSGMMGGPQQSGPNGPFQGNSNNNGSRPSGPFGGNGPNCMNNGPQQGNQGPPGGNMGPNYNNGPNPGWNGPQQNNAGPQQQWGHSQGQGGGPNFSQGNTSGPHGGMGGPQGNMGGQYGTQQSGPNGPQGAPYQGNSNNNGPRPSGPYGCNGPPQGNQCPGGNTGPNYNNGQNSGWNGPQQNNFGQGSSQQSWGQNGQQIQRPGNFSEGNMSVSQGSNCGPPGNVNGPQGNMSAPQGSMGPRGNMGGPQGNMGGGQGNMSGPQGNMGGTQGNMSGPQGNMGAQQGNMSGTQGNMGGPQGNMGGGPQGNMPGPQGNMGGPQGNMPGPQGNMGAPQGNMGGPQGNSVPQGNVSGPQGNMGVPQNNMGGPQGNACGPQGNMGGPQGNMSGPQGNMGPQVGSEANMGGPQGNMGGPTGNVGPQGNMNVPQGNASGPQGNMGAPPNSMGPQGNMGASQGNMGAPPNSMGPQGNISGNQCNPNGPQGNFGGPQGNMAGSQGNMAGPPSNIGGAHGNVSGSPPRPHCCPGQNDQFHQCPNNGPQQNMSGPNNQPPQMDRGPGWVNDQGPAGAQGSAPNWGNYQSGQNWNNNQGSQGPSPMGPGGPNQGPTFQAPPCDGPPGPRGPPPGCDGAPGPGPQVRYEQPPGPRGAPPGCDGPPQQNQPNQIQNMPSGPQYDGPLGPRGPPPGSDGPPNNWNPGQQEQRIPPPGYDGPPGPRGPPPGSDGPPTRFEEQPRNWGPPEPNVASAAPGPWPQQNVPDMGRMNDNRPPGWQGNFPPQGRDERPPPPGCDQEREPIPPQGWQGGNRPNIVFDQPLPPGVEMPPPRQPSPPLDRLDTFYREDDFDIDITRGPRQSPERERRRTSPNWDRDLGPRDRDLAPPYRRQRSPPREWRNNQGENDWSLPPPRRDSPTRGTRRPPIRRIQNTSPESGVRREVPPRRTSPNWREGAPFLGRRRSLSPIPRRRLSPDIGHVRHLSPERNATNRMSRERSITRRLSPERIVTRRLSPDLDIRRLSPARSGIRLLSPDRSGARRLSPARSSGRRLSPELIGTRRLSPDLSRTRRLSPERGAAGDAKYWDKSKEPNGGKTDNGSYWTKSKESERGDADASDREARGRSRAREKTPASSSREGSSRQGISRRSLSPPLGANKRSRRLGCAMPGGRIIQQVSPESRHRQRLLRNEGHRSHSVERPRSSRERSVSRRRGSDSTERGGSDTGLGLERKRKRTEDRRSPSRSRTSQSRERSRLSDPDRSRSLDERRKRNKLDDKITGNDAFVPLKTKENAKSDGAKETSGSRKLDSTVVRPVKRRTDGKQFEIPKGQTDSGSSPTEQGTAAGATASEAMGPPQPQDANKDQAEKGPGKAQRKSRDTKRTRSAKESGAGGEDQSSDGSFSYDPSPERYPFALEEMEDEPVADQSWIRCSPADLYFRNDEKLGCVKGMKKMSELEKRFYKELVKRNDEAFAKKPKYVPPDRRPNVHLHCHHQESDSDSCSSSDSDDDDDELGDSMNWMEELNRKRDHPYRLHEDMWFNEHGEMNDGPLCRCSLKARRSGIRHSIYPGESKLNTCEANASNTSNLYHYRVTMSPVTNFLTKNPTVIEHDDHEYIFDGFSLFSHYQLENIPMCKVIRFNIEYTIHFFEEPMPVNFTVRSLDMFTDYLFNEVLELLDLDWYGQDNDSRSGCKRFHLMPRFVRSLPENGREILSMNEVLIFLLRSAELLVDPEDLEKIHKYEPHEWQDIVDALRGMIVIHPGMKPSSIRVDQFDRLAGEFPAIVHFGIKPAQLSYAGDPNYQKLWKQYAKYKHLLANKPKVTAEDKMKLSDKEDQLQEIRMKSCMKREVTVEISGKGFIKTGIRSDMCQHALLLPVLISHLRFHRSLDVLERQIEYQFNDRNLLQRALTHPSYRVNYGTNPDHARNSLSNCGIRQPEFGDRKIHHIHSRKRGINTLINIMSRMGNKHETDSEIHHYERLEFLGDAVVEFTSSIHLFFMFPDLDEGGLATFRAALVQNQHLAVLAKKLKLQEYMLYAHGPDLCHDSDLRHAMANCLEALMGALFLDGDINLADRIFAATLFDEKDLHKVWENLPQHPLQEEEPTGDRHWIKSSAVLQKLIRFEDMTGIEFNNIRLLARAFTPRNLGFNNLTLGHNQRLEFLGDTVLQLVASEYLFKHFPEHHEGHLSLLRSSLVNNRTQSVVCDDLGMTEFVSTQDDSKTKEMKMKEKADLLEAFIGALYVDKGVEFCRVFAQVCFFPRLKAFIMNQEWNDPKSQLQQCCLTLRELDGGEPDIPIYKVLETTGPTNTRRFTVAVYFRGMRLATGSSHSIQQAEMNAATNALSQKSHLFPQLSHQKMFIEKKYHLAAKRARAARRHADSQSRPMASGSRTQNQNRT